MATADSLAERGSAAIGRRARVLLFDLAGVSFCDAGGLGALVRVANHTERADCRLGSVAPPPQMVKLLQITGPGGRLPTFAAISDALAHLMPGQQRLPRGRHRPRRAACPVRGVPGSGWRVACGLLSHLT